MNYNTIKNRYNTIMERLAYEHLTVGQYLSENGSGDPANVRNILWTPRDMVAEADYILSTYFENGHVNGELRYGDANERKMWRQETGYLKRFIDRFKADAIKNYECFQRHCSKFD